MMVKSIQPSSPRSKRSSIYDGQDLKAAIISGTTWLEKNKETVNALNVFPVPDGDTGTNMTLTLKSALKEITEVTDTSASLVAAKVARGALMGARGNSGVILSQILRGLAQGIGDKATITTDDLAHAFEEAENLAFRAVIKPVEGTILSVVQQAAKAAKASSGKHDDIAGLMQDIVMAAKSAVARTPEQLPILKQAGVVDAGGQGFCFFLEGIWRYTRGEAAGENDVQVSTAEVRKGTVSIEEEYGYEVVFMLKGDSLDTDSIRNTLTSMGGVSVVVASDGDLVKVHAHTLTPGKILDYGVGLGSLMDINIENLQEQSLRYADDSRSVPEEAASKDIPVNGELSRKIEQVSIVAVAAGEGFDRVFESMGVESIVPGGQTMNPSTEELLKAVNEASSDHVILLPNNSNVILSARQVPELADKQVYIVNTETLPQGIAALLAYNYEADFNANCEAMEEARKNIQTAEITTAVRSVQLGNIRVREGDVIGLLNGNLVTAGPTLQWVINETLQRMGASHYEIFTLYYGEGISKEEAQGVAKQIKELYPKQEIEVINGGQPYYAYVISAE